MSILISLIALVVAIWNFEDRKTSEKVAKKREIWLAITLVDLYGNQRCNRLWPEEELCDIKTVEAAMTELRCLERTELDEEKKKILWDLYKNLVLLLRDFRGNHEYAGETYRALQAWNNGLKIETMLINLHVVPVPTYIKEHQTIIDLVQRTF